MSVFGAEFEQVWPKAGSALKLTKFGTKLLEKCQSVEKPDTNKVELSELIRRSSNFPIEFGTNTCRIISQPKSRHPIIRQQFASAYPVIHERVVGLYLDFLEHKSQYGTACEISVYKNLTLTGLIDRLLTKRCASFIYSSDKFLLLTRESGSGGFNDVGTDLDKHPLVLDNVLSYDEIKLSALLSVSSHSEFINDGNRFNNGVVEENKSKIEVEGVVIGIIGARFEVPFVMEYQDIVISSAQNNKNNGYGLPINFPTKKRTEDYRRLWKNFYEEKDFQFDEVTVNNERFGRTTNGIEIFDNLIMKKRYTISFDTLLLDSEARAAAAGKSAYIHVVGIGLGVWEVADQQEKIFLETFAQRLEELLPQLPHVDVVHFSWFHLTEWGTLKHGGIFKSETHPKGGIRTFLSKRNPADKLLPDFHDMLLIVSYAWDGNALPGNEFWTGMLSSSGDPSTASSTLIAEIHNPHINKEAVCGDNLHIATSEYGVIHIADYAKQLLSKLDDYSDE